MGFHWRWVELIMRCVVSVSYKITHARREVGPIIPTRGLRQGDPLSPYLFILSAEGLSALIRKNESQKKVQGVRVCRQAPSITHMFFADDSYLYCRANEDEARCLITILENYERASGQQVNKSKSSVFFSSNIGEERRHYLCQVLQMIEAGDDCTYLGLPNMMRRSKSATLGFLKEKVKQRIDNWDGRHISQGGREILVKSVAQALPTYAMSVFMLPSDITKDLERMITKYWWHSHSKEKKGITWMNWERLSRHKATGGMGFRDFKDFNVAMLGKQAWRFITSPNSLVSRLFKARYFPKVSFFDAEVGNNPSFIWRSILEAKDLIKSGMRWRIRSGQTINIVGQPWLIDDHNPFITSDPRRLTNLKVSTLMSSDHRSWNEEVLNELFNERDRRCILNIQIRETMESDNLYWCKEASGNYSVRSAYRLLQAQKSLWRQQDNSSLWRKIWRIKAPSKVLNFLWRALSNCLPTKVMLAQKRVPVDHVCPVCKNNDETIIHALVLCPVAAQCWQIVLPEVVRADFEGFSQWWEEVFSVCSGDRRAEVAAVCWAFWKARNNLVWNNKYTRVYVVIALAKQYLVQWRAAQKGKFNTLNPNFWEGDGAVVWAKPQEETIKINVDGATFEEYQATGVGMIARNHTGHLVQARTICLNSLHTAEMIEAIAIKEALSWVKSQQWKQVVLESDSLVVIQAIRSKVPMVSPFGCIIEECRRIIQELNTFSLLFIKRSANMAAHELARASYSYPDRVFDGSSIPVGVMNVILVDAS